MVRDITERKTAEELIKAALEDKQTALDDMRSCGKLVTEIIAGFLSPSRNLTDEKILKDARQRMKTLAFTQSIILEAQHLSKPRQPVYFASCPFT